MSYQLPVTKFENCFIENLLKIENCELKTAQDGGLR